MSQIEPKKKRRSPKMRDHKVVARHVKIIQLILEDPLNITPATLARKLKVHLSTTKRDLKDPELRLRLREALQNLASNEATQKAMKNVEAWIDAGDPDMSKWLLEKTRFFPPEQVEVTNIEGTAPADATEEEVAKQVDAVFAKLEDSDK